MAGRFASVFGVLMVVFVRRWTHGSGTPQPEQIHISSTGWFSEFCGFMCDFSGFSVNREGLKLRLSAEEKNFQTIHLEDQVVGNKFTIIILIQTIYRSFANSLTI